MNKESNNAIDIAVIKGLVGDDPGMIQYFFNKFIETVPGNIQEIENSLNNKDYPGIKSSAHKLKSSAKAVGAASMVSICQSMEDESLAGNVEALNEYFERLVQAYEHCKDFMESY